MILCVFPLPFSGVGRKYKFQQLLALSFKTYHFVRLPIFNHHQGNPYFIFQFNTGSLGAIPTPWLPTGSTETRSWHLSLFVLLHSPTNLKMLMFFFFFLVQCKRHYLKCLNHDGILVLQHPDKCWLDGVICV